MGGGTAKTLVARRAVCATPVRLASMVGVCGSSTGPEANSPMSRTAVVRRGGTAPLVAAGAVFPSATGHGNVGGSATDDRGCGAGHSPRRATAVTGAGTPTEPQRAQAAAATASGARPLSGIGVMPRGTDRVSAARLGRGDRRRLPRHAHRDVVVNTATLRRCGPRKLEWTSSPRQCMNATSRPTVCISTPQ